MINQKFSTPNYLFNFFFVSTDDQARDDHTENVCICSARYDAGCNQDACEDLCLKLDVIDGYCSDKWTCTCVYRC